MGLFSPPSLGLTSILLRSTGRARYSAKEFALWRGEGKSMKILDQEVSNTRIISAIVVALFTLLTSTTIGEFLVALHNRYSIYAVGSDTNMYANSGMLTLILCFIGLFTASYILKFKFEPRTIAIFILSFFIATFVTFQVPSFVPQDWCQYELTIYPCGKYDEEGYGQSHIIDGQKLYINGRE